MIISRSFYKYICLGYMFFVGYSSVFCTHNTSRYFPFVERVEDYVTRDRSYITPAFFITNASEAFRRGGGKAGILELWGRYDLRDLIDSIQTVNPDFVNPIITERGPGDSWIDKSIKYKADGKIKGKGFIFNYQQNLKFNNLYLGAFFPIIYVNSSDRYTFVPSDSDPVVQNLKDGELAQLSRIRRNVHNALGLQGGDWTQTGVGDLDLHLKWNYNWDHRLMMRSINFNLLFGTVIPTGTVSDIDYPSSVSFMGNGCWSCYLDIATEFELKQDWKFGFILGGAYQFDHSRRLRIPIYVEPALFSALFANVKIDPGMTFKISPYIIAENLTDGISLQIKYTYLRHDKDKWNDKRSDKTISSYLTQTSGNYFGTRLLTDEDISKNIKQKEGMSLWREHYITFQASYDTKEAGHDLILEPIVFVAYDYQFSGNSSCKTHQFSVGIQLNF